MIKKEYRLEDYIIAEYDRFVYTWEMNMVLGRHRIGNCFMVGNLLIMEPWSHEKEGCLKLEFHERLRRLPVWNKSRYYCFSPSLRDTVTEQSLSNYFNRLQVNKDKRMIEPVKIFKPGIYRLARYKIIVEEKGNISWQIYEESNKLISGPCITESGILFICSKNDDVYEGQSKKEWVTRVRLLPKWDQTFAWGHWNILRVCSPEKEILKSGPLTWNSDHKREKIAKLLPSNLDRLRMYHTDKWKNLQDQFSVLFIDGLRIGGHIFLNVLKKIVFWVCKMKDCFFKKK